MSADSKPQVDALMREAFARHEAGDLARAAAGYRRILDLEPQHPEALYLLGEIANRQQRYADAVPMLEAAVALQPRIAAFRAELGRAAQGVGRMVEAIKLYHEAIALDARHAEAHIRLGDVLIRLGRYGEANEYLRTALRLKIAKEPARAPESPPARRIARTTLCCVDCTYHDLAAYALRRSQRACSFEHALFLTDRPVDVEGVQTVLIAPIRSVEDYSRFLIKELDRYIDTDFVLVIQYDGFVLDASRWTEAFQEYDYIGARWSFGDGYEVGNGGFSLRSKRLLRALQDEAIDHFSPEDMVICREYRDYLEEHHGVRFAPPALAEQFSFETAKPRGPTFGFHGLGHLAWMIDMSPEEVERYDPGPAEVKFKEP